MRSVRRSVKDGGRLRAGFVCGGGWCWKSGCPGCGTAWVWGRSLGGGRCGRKADVPTGDGIWLGAGWSGRGRACKRVLGLGGGSRGVWGFGASSSCQTAQAGAGSGSG